MGMDQEAAWKFIAGIIGDEEATKLQEEQKEDRALLIQEARIFHDVFGQGRGPELLELLRHKTVYLSTMDRDNAIVDGNISLNPGEFMAGREMQNALVRWIERMLKLSQEKAE